MPNSRSWIAYLYLLLAFSGAILTMLANFSFVEEFGPGFDLIKFIQLANVNPAAESLSRDLFVGAGAVSFWIVSESRRLKMKNLWFVIITTFLIAFAFAAPFFLFLRERRLIELKDQGLDIYKSI